MRERGGNGLQDDAEHGKDVTSSVTSVHQVILKLTGSPAAGKASIPRTALHGVPARVHRSASAEKRRQKRLGEALGVAADEET